MTSKYDEAIERIDAANADDPNVEIVDGRPTPKELVYGRRMSAWLARLYPEASEPLRLAVRAQHIRRWTSPRSTYPMDRRGYLRWRTDLKNFHAETASAILRDAGYDDPVIDTVASLLRKEGLRENPDAQALEDTACLVFLDHYFADFASQQEPDKVVEIVRKTWAKMSEIGRSAALTLSLPDSAGALVSRALAP
ncbi:MAG: DUF4202 domain-containing protein [Capsulimonadaceae bacterium]